MTLSCTDGRYATVRIWAISEFPKWHKYLISLSFRDKSSVRPVQVGGFEANIVVHRSTAVRGRGGPPPPWESSCRTRTGPVEADGTVDAQNAPTAPWKTLRVFHELPQGLSHRITHAKPRKAPKWRWEIRIDPGFEQRYPAHFASRSMVALLQSARTRLHAPSTRRRTVTGRAGVIGRDVIDSMYANGDAPFCLAHATANPSASAFSRTRVSRVTTTINGEGSPSTSVVAKCTASSVRIGSTGNGLRTRASTASVTPTR